MQETEDLGILNINSSLYKTRLSHKFKNRKPYKSVNPKIVKSFIPGTVIDILVEEGQEINKNDYILILDAMKMKNKIMSHTGGTVKKIHVKKGDRVSKGRILLEFA